MKVITGRNEVVAKVMFLQLCVILFTGGVCLSACWDTPHQGDPFPPKKEAPPAKETPHEGEPPCQGGCQEGGPPSQGDPPKKEAPKKETPQEGGTPKEDPLKKETPQEGSTPPKEAPPQEGDPQEADSGIRSMSGQYASYWNAFLLSDVNASTFRLVLY